MNKALKEQLYQAVSIPKDAGRPGLAGSVVAGRCSLDKVLQERDLFDENLSGVHLTQNCCQAEIKLVSPVLIAADMNNIDLVERQTVVGFDVSPAFYANQIDKKHKQTDLNANGGLFDHPPMEVFHEQM